MKIANEFLLIWKDKINHHNYTVGNLKLINSKYYFEYNEDKYNAASEKGMPAFPGFPDMIKYESETIFSNILSRLPNKKRDNYDELIRLHGIKDPENVLEALQKTKGSIVTDSFEFVPLFNNKKVNFNIAGINHNLSTKHYKYIQKNLKLSMQLEDNNGYDKNAVLITFKNPNQKEFDDIKIGYVPNYYNCEVKECILKGKKYTILVKKYKLDEEIPLNERYIEVNIEFF